MATYNQIQGGEASILPHLREVPSSTSKEGEPPKSREKSPWAPSPKMSMDSPSRNSSCCSKCSPPSKEHQDMCEKDSHGSSSKHQDKSRSDKGSKDKESSKTPWKCVVSLPQKPSSTEWAGKEPCLNGPSLTFNASSQSWHSSPSRHLSETDDQASFMGPNSTSTPNKTGGAPYVQSVSSNSRHSMTPFEMGLGGSFSIPSYAGARHSSITPVTSIAGSQQVTSSRWHQSASFSPLTPQVTDTLSTEQATEVYELTAECSALGSELAKQFQTLSGLKSMHCTVAQAMAHETVLAHSTTYEVAMTIQRRMGVNPVWPPCRGQQGMEGDQ